MLRQIIFSITLLVCVSSCSIIYTPPVSQGTNFTAVKDIKEKLIGKTRNQIYAELGKPMLEIDTPDQIIYVHSTRTGHHPTQVQQLVITLTHDKAADVKINTHISEKKNSTYLTAEK